MIYRTNTGSRSLSGDRLPHVYFDDFSWVTRQDGNHAWSGEKPMRFSGSCGRSWTGSGNRAHRVDSGISRRVKMLALLEFAE